MAQARHESTEFVNQKEIWGPTKAQKGYEGRKDLCHKLVGDGKRFMGRGLLQITGRCNYTAYTKYKNGKGLNIDFTIEPNNKILETLPYCVDASGWYWSEKLEIDLNTYADKDDAIYITYRINGGFNGYVEDRKPKLISMIKNSIECKNSNYSSYSSYSIKRSKCWDLYAPIYLYAALNTNESKDCYRRYLELTDNYLSWSTIKGWENDKTGKKKEAKEKMERKRKNAQSKI